MPIAPETVTTLRALGDPVRVRILAELAARPAGVTDLAERLPITRQGTAKHLHILRDAGLVSADPAAGRHVTYRAEPRMVEDASHALAAEARMWRTQLSLVKAAAEDDDRRREK